jgi:hypothetical protein
MQTMANAQAIAQSVTIETIETMRPVSGFMFTLMPPSADRQR